MDGLEAAVGAGDPAMKEGLCIYTYVANAPMTRYRPVMEPTSSVVRGHLNRHLNRHLNAFARLSVNFNTQFFPCIVFDHTISVRILVLFYLILNHLIRSSMTFVT